MDALLRDGLAALAAADRDAARALAGPSGEAAAERLERYMAEIELFNPAYGLVGAADRRELVVKHILDSLAPLGALLRLLDAAGPAPRRIADAGSGAGLPGIPLALALGGHRFTLIERMGRRVGFLENTAAVLGLDNVEVEQKDVEKAAPGRFDLVTFRAFRPLDAPMLKALFRLLAPGGVLAAYKARQEKVEEEMAAVESIVGSWEAVETPVPFLDEPRRLVVVRQK